MSGTAALRAGGMLAVALAAVSCGRHDRSADGSLVLGAVLPLSGPDAAEGQDVLTGLHLAASRVQGEPRVHIRAMDGEGMPGLSARRFRELSGDPSVGAIVGGWFAANARTLGAISGSEGIAFLALSSLALPTGQPPAPLFQSLHRAATLGSAAAAFTREDLGVVRAGILRIPGSEASETLARAFAAGFQSHGGQILWNVVPDDAGKLDFPAGPESPVESIFVAGHSVWAERCLTINTQSRDANVILTGGWDLSSIRSLIEKGSAVFVTRFWFENDPSPPAAEFLEACHAEGISPSAPIAFGWDAVRLMQLAGRSESVSRSGIRNFFRNGPPMEGVTGRIGPGGLTSFTETPAVLQLTEEGPIFVRRIETTPEVGEA